MASPPGQTRRLHYYLKGLGSARRRVMAAASGAANSEGKQLPSETETMIWKPRKECLLQNIPNVPDGKSEESESASTSPNEGDVSGSTDEGWYNIYADLDVWDSEVSNVPESSGQQDATEHEVEDWDKELEESTCGPYDADDLSCGSFEENNFFGSYVWKEDWFYNPGCGHAPCFVFPPRVRTVEQGQFDDADE